jgi:hypothetical protein
MTRKQKIIILFLISFPVFLVGYFLVSKQTSTEPKTALQEQKPLIKIKETEKGINPHQKEIEATDTNLYIDNDTLSKKTSDSPYTSPYELPHELYLKHIKLAEDGIPESQYYVYLALRVCRGAQLTYEGLIKRQEKFPKHSLSMEKEFKKCEKFAALLNKNNSYANKSFKELADLWYEISFENEYPLAISNKMMYDNSNSYSNYEKRTALQNTIKLGRYEGYSDVHLYYRVRAFKKRDVTRSHLGAWGAITCDKSEACSISEYLKKYKMYLSYSEYKKLNEKFESIKDSIERKAWDELEIFEEQD